MSVVEFIWGALVIVAGVFICVYGNLLFRFVLAAIGVAVGFGAGMILTDGQSDGLRLLVSLAIGGIAGIVLYGLVRFGIYVAGGLLGVVIALIVTSLIDLLSDRLGIIGVILVVAGAAAGAYLGPRLGDRVIVWATAAAGAYLIVYGLTVLFTSQFAGDVTDPSANFARRSTLTVFAVLVAVSGLAQFNIQQLRRRLRS